MKNVGGYEGKYLASTDGRIWSVRRRTWLRGGIATTGYPIVILCKNGRQRTHLVHRLIALTYIPNPLKKRQVNHLDKNKRNNSVSNLEWVTPQENMYHHYGTNPAAKLQDLIDSGIDEQLARYALGIKETAVPVVRTADKLLLMGRVR